jgi:hypothetical protein
MFCKLEFRARPSSRLHAEDGISASTHLPSHRLGFASGTGSAARHPFMASACTVPRPLLWARPGRRTRRGLQGYPGDARGGGYPREDPGHRRGGGSGSTRPRWTGAVSGEWRHQRRLCPLLWALQPAVARGEVDAGRGRGRAPSSGHWNRRWRRGRKERRRSCSRRRWRRRCRASHEGQEKGCGSAYFSHPRNT